jgi:hypothetical protein
MMNEKQGNQTELEKIVINKQKVRIMETIKKIIVVLLMAAGIILLMGESEMTWERTLLLKLIGIGSLAGALQLTATWKLFRDFIDN